MIITITIYSFIILYIIGRGFYISRKPICNVQNRESFQDSISLSAMPFYSNIGSINLFAFFINFLLLSFISISLLPDLFFNTITYCMDNENTKFEEKMKLIKDIYEISDTKHSTIYHLNHDNVIIKDGFKASQSFFNDINAIFEKQYNLHTKIPFLNKRNDLIIHQEMFHKSMLTSHLISNAYDKIINFNNDIKNYNNQNHWNIFDNDNYSFFFKRQNVILNQNFQVERILYSLDSINQLLKQEEIDDFNLNMSMINFDNIQPKAYFEFKNSIKKLNYNEQYYIYNANFKFFQKTIDKYHADTFALRNIFLLRKLYYSGLTINDLSYYFGHQINSETEQNYYNSGAADYDNEFNNASSESSDEEGGYNWEHTDIY